MSIGNFPESLSQANLAGIILVGPHLRPCDAPRPTQVHYYFYYYYYYYDSDYYDDYYYYYYYDYYYYYY